MEPTFVTTLVCPACHAEVSTSAETCPQCGKPLAVQSTSAPPAAESSLQRILDHRGLLLLLLFGATAALGIPLLWKSRVFSLSAKILLTIALCAYTVLILWLFWIVVSRSLESIQQSLESLR